MSGNQYRLIGAAGTLLLGVAYAGNLYLRPPALSGPDPATIRTLAERTAAQQRELSPVSLQVTAPASPAAAPPPAPRPRRAPERRARPASTPSAGTAADAAPAAASAESPVKNIALMGVTFRDNTDRAWLVDLETRERAVAAEGEEAFGFTVKDIEGDSVLLARDEDEYPLRLGEKQIPVVEAPEPPAATTTTAANNFGGGGRAMRRWMRQQAAASGGNWNRGNWNRGNWNRGNWNRGNWNNGGGDRNNRQRWGGSGGGFNPQAFMQRAMAGQGRNRQNGASFAAPASTSNPQTARRSGARLIGGARAIPEPSAINNPQTRRRRGSTSGPAFGQTGQRRF